MGPAASHYRGRAKEIVEQATRLLSAVDDLDTAARIETKRLVLEESLVDVGAVLQRLQQAFSGTARQRHARITVKVASRLPAIRAEPGTTERMLARLLAAAVGLAAEQEVIRATLEAGDLGGQPMVVLSVDRPKTLTGLAEAEMLDPGYSPAGDWPEGPTLGLGFSLRLVRNLAEAAGGALVIGDRRFLLYLPAGEPADLPSEQQG